MAKATWMVHSIVSLALLGGSLSVWAAPKSCKNEPLGAGADKMTCVYEGQSLNQAYAHVRGVLDGGILLREQFPKQAVSDDLPENNDEGLEKAHYSAKGGIWSLKLDYQGGTTRVQIKPNAGQIGRAHV